MCKKSHEKNDSTAVVIEYTLWCLRGGVARIAEGFENSKKVSNKQVGPNKCGLVISSFSCIQKEVKHNGIKNLLTVFKRTSFECILFYSEIDFIFTCAQYIQI